LLPFDEELTETIVQLRSWRDSIKQAISTIKEQALLSRNYPEFLTVPGLPATNENRTLSRDNLVSSLHKDHEDLQTYTLFTQVLQEAEDHSDTLKLNLQGVSSLGLVCLCRLQLLLSVHHSDVITQRDVTDDVMPAEVRRVTSDGPSRWIVADVTLRHSLARVDRMLTEYSRMLENIEDSS